MTHESTPRIDELDEGWSDEEEDQLDAAWGDEDGDEEEDTSPPVPGAPPRERTPKKVRPKRAPREVRVERVRSVEQKKAQARAEKLQRAQAKQKPKQAREKKPPRTGPSKQELRRQRAAEMPPTVATFEGAPDLAVDDAASKRRGGSLQDALKAKKGHPGGVPPLVGYLVLALLVGGAALYLLLR